MSKLIEIALHAYTIAFKIFMIGGKLAESIIKAVKILGIKNKSGDTIGNWMIKVV